MDETDAAPCRDPCEEEMALCEVNNEAIAPYDENNHNNKGVVMVREAKEVLHKDIVSKDICVSVKNAQIIANINKLVLDLDADSVILHMTPKVPQLLTNDIKDFIKNTVPTTRLGRAQRLVEWVLSAGDKVSEAFYKTLKETGYDDVCKSLESTDRNTIEEIVNTLRATTTGSSGQGVGNVNINAHNMNAQVVFHGVHQMSINQVLNQNFQDGVDGSRGATHIPTAPHAEHAPGYNKIVEQSRAEIAHGEKAFQERPEYQEAIKALDSKHILLITGPPKSGKSSLGWALLRHYDQHGYTPLVLRSYKEWRAHVPDIKQAVLLENIFGNEKYDELNCKEWTQILPSAHTLANKSQCLTVITASTSVMNEVKNSQYKEKICESVYTLVLEGSKD